MLRLRPRTIRWWVGGLVAGTALPLLLLLALLFLAQARREQREARQAQMRLATATVARLRAMHADSQELAARLALVPGLAELHPAECRPGLMVLSALPSYAGAYLFDGAQRLVCSAGADEHRRLIEVAEPWIAAQVRTGALHGARSVMHLFDKTPALVVASPVGRGGTLILVELLDVRGRAALAPESLLMIVDRRGTIVARSDAAERWVGHSASETGLLDVAAHESQGMVRAAGVDGVEREYGFARMPEVGWTIYAGVPTEVVNEPVRELLASAALGAVGILTIVCAMAYVFSRKIGRPLHSLASVAREDADGHAPRTGGPIEIATLGHAFHRMAARREETTERLRSGEIKLKALSERLLTAQEEERTRIARELHDDLGQSLTALKMDLIGLLQPVLLPPEKAPLRERVLRTLDATMRSVQEISSELRPSVLDDLGLVTAIEAEAKLFEERSGIECDVSVAGDAPIDPAWVTPIYRIVQEALTNVARHSNATRVEIRLRHRDDELLLEIRDDGRGLTGREMHDPLSLGLIGIRERADLIGAEVQFEGIEGRGTIVSLRIPSDRTARQA